MPQKGKTMSNVPNEAQVSCVNKKDRMSKHEHITHIGDGLKWRLKREKAIEYVDANPNAFYTLVNGKKAYLGVVRPANGDPYLRTHADGYWNDNLLALPECNGACAIVG
jgi:hypothetical protein